MSNSEVITHFVDAFLTAPNFTIEALQARLAHTEYRITFTKSVPLRLVKSPTEDEVYLFPMHTGEKGGDWIA